MIKRRLLDGVVEEMRRLDEAAKEMLLSDILREIKLIKCARKCQRHIIKMVRGIIVAYLPEENNGRQGNEKQTNGHSV